MTDPQVMEDLAPNDAVDYRKILVSYIDLVLSAEGTDFLLGGPVEPAIPELNVEERVALAKARDLCGNRDRRWYDEDGVPLAEPYVPAWMQHATTP